MKSTPKIDKALIDEAWKEQFARVKRWHKKTKRISRERASISEEELDVLFAFFQNCWHLYDWLKHSNALSVEVLDNFFRKNETMKLCYDICIGTKHLKMDRPKRSLPYLAFGVEYMGEEIGEVRTQLVLFKGGTQALTLVADNCMLSVESFLRENNLL